MTALAQSYSQTLFEGNVLVKAKTIAASVTIYGGTLAMNDAGKVKVFTSAGYVAGAKLLGFPQDLHQERFSLGIVGRFPGLHPGLEALHPAIHLRGTEPGRAAEHHQRE